MAENYDALKLIKEDHQFQFHIAEYTAFIEYQQTGNVLALLHTEVPGELEGQGVAAALVQRILGYAQVSGLKIIPECAYVVAFLKRHPEWNSIIEKSS